MRLQPTLGAIFRACGTSFIERHGATPRQRAVMRHVATCRTSALGGHEYACESCGHPVIAWNSCRDRHCPLCQRREAAAWVDAIRQRLLPTHYFHVVFTIPHDLNLIVLLNKKRCYGIHFRAAAETLKTVLADPERLGGEPAFTSVLHTWTSDLKYHVHVHSLVSGGGLSPDGQSWIASRPDFLVSVKVLSRVFRGKYLDYLGRAHADRKHPLNLTGDAAHLADPDEFARLKDRLHRKKWVVYAKKPLKGPLEVCKYFAGYTHRVGISNSRIVSVVDGRVRFLVRRRAKDGTCRGMRETTLEVDRFIGRFLLHVLPRGYTRIRHYGLTAPRNVKTRLPVARKLLEESETRSTPTDVPASGDGDAEPPRDPSVCPKCGGRMLLMRAVQPEPTEYCDTS